MDACASAIVGGGTLLAEAGTGTGKTFAYLIPLLVSGKRSIISTRTINLQEQLVRKDLRFLGTLLDFTYAIAKGRSNYLCLRRLNAFRAESPAEEEDYRRVSRWASETSTGDIEDFGISSPIVWDRLCTDADACTGKGCPSFSRCFYFEAKRRWDDAQIIVANHALTAINALMSDDSKLFPPAEVLVIDEAHSLERTLSDQIGITLSNRGFDYILNRVLRVDDRGVYKGLFSLTQSLFTPVERLRTELAALWIAVRTHCSDRTMIRGDIAVKQELLNVRNASMELIESAREGTIGLFSEDDEIELKATLLKLGAHAEAVAAYLDGSDDAVRWAEVEQQRTALRMSPLYPRSFMLTEVLPQHESVILTSATLSANGDFRLMQELLGLEQAQTLSLPSPFDPDRQISIQIEKGIDLRNDETSVLRLAATIGRAAAEEPGGMLVLFTSRDVMRRTWSAAAAELRSIGRNPMMQGDLYQNRSMLEIMRDSTDSVIFGLDSFWEGVDLQGDALRCLVITKLPFEVPTEPITQARTEDISRRGRNAFLEYSLPRAILKFKQGFGRLIRSQTDTGRVIICDERIITKRYGKAFLLSVLSQEGVGRIISSFRNEKPKLA
ncbi:MAG TPA: ATP-dependent DNA helicase [Dissulfurispiraceae bacterium]|nr:ATP-dependent DNA helicase [Dissulfurispiraceae bacterium]